ncbi:MAG: winged helix-turn-helix transcriptional regulator [Thermococcus sp.]|nr:winged helix-turn-helix transcriptional regulator [Thermococcus sp.]
MKLREAIETLDEKQKMTVLRSYEREGIPDLDLEVETGVDRKVLEFLKAISNPLRFQLLKLLSKGWLCVCVIAGVLDRDQTLISHHLRTLKEVGLILEKKVGKMHFYRTDVEKFEKYLEAVKSEIL